MVSRSGWAQIVQTRGIPRILTAARTTRLDLRAGERGVWTSPASREVSGLVHNGDQGCVVDTA